MSNLFTRLIRVVAQPLQAAQPVGQRDLPAVVELDRAALRAVAGGNGSTQSPKTEW
ncbi:hypothetical protein [Ideonella livida]|uniref:Uncharacterized protein n=1 Tax=Ideonella livida TaxID=2707176 RepID=A0A7C9PJL9_9BURK|nr:hypothetical protein [Ideonella livida]NDY92710.1 hypothetical protein [Ideonella livida]